MIIPGNTINTPATTFSNPESLNLLKVTIAITAKAGTTATYKIVNILTDSVIKKNCPAKRKANVADNQIKNPIPRTGKAKDLFMTQIICTKILLIRCTLSRKSSECAFYIDLEHSLSRSYFREIVLQSDINT